MLLGLAGTRVEGMFPDLHDSDGLGTTSVVATGFGATADRDAPVTPPVTPSCHSTHLEHCGHSHLVTVAQAPFYNAQGFAHAPQLTRPAIRPSSLAAPPRQRPPIV